MNRIPTGNPPIDQAWFGIWYQPMQNEIDPAELAFVKERSLKASFVIPLDRTSDPKEALERILLNPRISEGGNRPVYLFIPGTAFDAFGTRHGRGGGWYDRFLALAPRSWLRIGIAKRAQISNTPLEREAWDEPMDWLLTS